MPKKFSIDLQRLFYFFVCAPATFWQFFKMINYILSGTFPVMIWRIFGLVNPDFGYHLLRDRSNLLREIATANFCLLWIANWIYFEFLKSIRKNKWTTNQANLMNLMTCEINELYKINLKYCKKTQRKSKEWKLSRLKSKILSPPCN